MHQSILSKTIFLASVIGLLVSAATFATGASIELGVTTDADGLTRTTAVVGKDNPRATSLEDKITAGGARKMNGDEVRAYLSNNTQQWANGGAFYETDGRLDFIWEGKTFYNYTWNASGDGEVCIKNREGFTTSCSLYFDYKQSVWSVVIEVFGESRDFFGGPDTILDGNSLSSLEPWDPALSGN